MSDTKREECYAESVLLAHQLKSRGQYLAANPLHPTSTATSVRMRDGKVLVTDGPFAETCEQLGGEFLIDGKEPDEAIGARAAEPTTHTGALDNVNRKETTR